MIYTDPQNYQNIAAAIREKLGVETTYKPAQMAAAIRSIETQPEIQPLTVTENGTYTAPDGVDGYSPVTVSVSGGEAIVEPLTVTENGTYNPPAGVDGYAPVTVNVQGGGGVMPIEVLAGDWSSQSVEFDYGTGEHDLLYGDLVMLFDRTSGAYTSMRMLYVSSGGFGASMTTIGGSYDSHVTYSKTDASGSTPAHMKITRTTDCFMTVVVIRRPR